MSEELIPAREFGWISRSLGERGIPEAVIAVGPPSGHTRPQWIIAYGGLLTADGASRRLSADYS